MDFWNMAKNAFQNAYLSGIKKKLIITGVGILIFIILITILVCVIINNDENKQDTNGTHILNGTMINPFQALLSREEFIECVKNYSPSGNQISYENNMIPYAEAFYDICTENGVCPELAFAHACLETGYGSSSQAREKKNYFGMGAYNTNESNATTYATVEDSIRGYCEWVKTNASPESSAYQSNVERATELSPYNSLLEGTPDANAYVLYIRYAVLYPTHDSSTTQSQRKSLYMVRNFIWTKM